MTKFSLSWDVHKNNICAGLSTLQQNGEFVDMTLAADGHHVKVHQLVMSLASPYIKEIITSTQCQHPVIFLNKISYATLCAILEYIYTGEVVVTKENLDELILAGKELHIKGLQDMNVDIATKNDILESQVAGYNEGHQIKILSHNKDPDEPPPSKRKIPNKKNIQRNTAADESEDIEDVKTAYLSDNVDDYTDDFMDTTDNPTTANASSSQLAKVGSRVQYTLSNQGALQMILNRYLYRVGYTSTRNRSVKRWRCAENKNRHCRAVVYTKDNVVIRRQAAHNHPFHDKKILRKIQEKAVYSAINEAESEEIKIRESKSKAKENVKKD